MSCFVKEEKDSGKNTGFFLYGVEKDIYCVAILYCGGILLEFGRGNF